MHSDIWGPAPISSLLDYNYYVVFIDDYTRFTWFFLLKQKHELFTVFKHFKNLVETQYSTKIKILRPDNGKEYVNSQFQEFFSNHGIIHQTSYPHTPQQNGISERKHRHIVETGLALLYRAHLPLNFWFYAFSTASFLINRLPSSVIGLISPWELVNGVSPSLSAFKTFACACYPYICPYNKHKLHPRFVECVFLGYPPLSKGYLCLDTSTNKVYITSYALFNENLFPFAVNPTLTHAHLPFSADVTYEHRFASDVLIAPTNTCPDPSYSVSPVASFPFELFQSPLPFLVSLILPYLLYPLHLMHLLPPSFLALLLLVPHLILLFLFLSIIILCLQDQNWVSISRRFLKL